MFSPKAADSYQPGINQVVDDAAVYLRQHPYPEDLNRFLMNVSFEMLAQVLLDRRMGLIDLDGDITTDAAAAAAKTNKSVDEQQFVTSAVEGFHALGELLMKPPMENLTLLRCLPVWNRLERNMDQVWDIGMKWLIEAEEQQSDVAFVTKLAGQEKMGRQERLVNLVTLLQAGVDTTSNTLVWTLYELAKRPHVQERLRRELREAIGLEGDGGYNRSHMSDLPYLKAFLREVQRTNPAAAGTMRRFPFDVEAGGYVLEKNTIILWNQEAYAFDEGLLGGDPNEFVPERWLAAEVASKLYDDLDPRKPVHVDGFDVPAPAPILSNPLMTTAFMVGPRMCVGARIAQNEIHSLVSKLCRDFELSLDPPNQQIERVPKLLMTPDPAPRIRFKPLA
jgi:cytochrome P450